VEGWDSFFRLGRDQILIPGGIERRRKRKRRYHNLRNKKKQKKQKKQKKLLKTYWFNIRKRQHIYSKLAVVT
jgi:hypothetical protein